MINSNYKHCYNCHYRLIDNKVKYGICTFFKKLGKQPKAIPEYIFTKGCDNFESKKFNKIVKLIIDLFDGEIIK